MYEEDCGFLGGWVGMVVDVAVCAVCGKGGGTDVGGVGCVGEVGLGGDERAYGFGVSDERRWAYYVWMIVDDAIVIWGYFWAWVGNGITAVEIREQE